MNIENKTIRNRNKNKNKQKQTNKKNNRQYILSRIQQKKKI